MPTQGVFRQKPWLPWWLIPLLALLLLLLLFLFLRSQPQNVRRARRSSARSRRSTAEEKLTEADLKLDPNKKEQVDDKAPAGHDPRADAEGRREGREGHAGGGPGRRRHAARSTCPTSSSKTAERRRQGCCARKELTLGQASPQPRRPEGHDRQPRSRPRARSSRPARRSTSSTPTRPTPRTRRSRRTRRRTATARAAAAAAGGAGGGGGEAAADIIVPRDRQGRPRRLRQEGRPTSASSRSVRKEFNDAPKRHAVRDRAARRHEGRAEVRQVTLLVSVGQPQVVFTNGKDILRINGGQRRKARPGRRRARTRRRDPTWSADGDARRLHRRRPRDAQGHDEEELGRGRR